MLPRSLFLSTCLLLSAGLSSAEVRLPKILGSHMVLQREQPIHIWGWSDPGESVSVAFNGSTQTAKGDELGHWSLYLPPHAAGGPFQIAVSSSNRVVLDDVLIGDLWFASGQSNMEMPLKGFTGSAVIKNSAAEIQQANHPDIRLLFIPHKASPFPLQDFDSDIAWTTCNPKTAADFSAVAYFFGRELAAHQHVPIGLIDSSWGGTPIESWISADAISSDSSLMPVFAVRAKMLDEQADLPAITAHEKREDAAARESGNPLPHHPWHPDPASWSPSWLFNAMVAPATELPIRGVIWYQGESNSPLERAPLYARLFVTMIGDWRQHWEQGHFPFLYAQISSFTSTPTEDWPAIRDAQRRALSVTDTAMAVTTDIGTPDNVHPPDKQTVGLRLALGARALSYGEKITYSGPLFRSAHLEGASVRILFDDAGSNLVAQGGAPAGFEIAGKDAKFVAATAVIDGSTIVLSAPSISEPKFVRYGASNAPDSNIFNSEHLPASTFTSQPVR